MRYIIAVVTACVVVGSSYSQDWPQWRGPNRDGIVPKDQPFPKTLQNLKPVWSITDLGASYSGPIVAEGLVFTTATVNNKDEVVTAYKLTDGSKVWSQSWTGAMTVPFFAARNGSWIRSTPAYFDGKLYVGGMRDYLVCLDAKTGKTVWKCDFPTDYKTPLPTFGMVCSPLVDETGVYVQAGAGFAKLDRLTGKMLWQTLKDDGGMNGSAFASPVKAKVVDREQLLVQTRTKLAGVDPDDGTVLWEKEVPSFRGMNILTPQPYGQSEVFTSTYGGTTQTISLEASGSTISPTSKWSIKYEGNMTSPVVVNDVAYLLGRDQRLIAFDLKKGKEAWRSEGRFGQYWSLVASGDKILGLDQRGILFLLKANAEEFELLEQKKVVDSESWAHIALAGNKLIIRDLNTLSVFEFEP